jgi:hypothetical protein
VRHQPQRDKCGAEHGDSAGEKHDIQPRSGPDQSKCGTRKSLGQVRCRLPWPGRGSARARGEPLRYTSEKPKPVSAAPAKTISGRTANQISAWPMASINVQTSATFAPPIASAKWLKNPRQYESNRVRRVGEPSVSPTSACVQQGDEPGHCTETYTAKCRAEARHPYGTNHFDEREASVLYRSNRRKGRNQQQSSERGRRGGECDGRKAVGCIERSRRSLRASPRGCLSSGRPRGARSRKLQTDCRRLGRPRTCLVPNHRARGAEERTIRRIEEIDAEVQGFVHD